MKFPTVRSYDLEGKMVCLPARLAGEANLLLVAYGVWHWWQFDDWLPLAERLQSAFKCFTYYAIPVVKFGRIPQVPFYSEHLLPNSRILSLDCDTEQLRNQLKIATDLNITVLLLRKDGTISWRSSGALTAKKASELDEAILQIAHLHIDHDG